MSDSKYKVEFTLKQHTPIIHFQSGQPGATLRATELKPKLDKYLLKYVEGIPYRKNTNGHRYLDYKVKITNDTSVEVEMEERPPLYFANTGKSEDEKMKQKFGENNYPVVNFFSFDEKVKNAIKDHFEAFLANTNFGTRQSKGFGSFYLVNETSKKPFPFNQELIHGTVYSFPSTVSRWDKDIGLLYAFLRQGINLPNKQGTRFYTKPAIFLYAKEKMGWEWDKKVIKAYFFSDILQDQQGKYSADSAVNYSSDKQYLLRDLFGLSSTQKWGRPYDTTINKEHNEIERFQSPITFKFVEGRVYFWSNGTEKEILDQNFTVIVKGKKMTLRTPSEFDFNAFFEFVKTIDLSKVVEPRFQSQQKYRDLTRMLKSIKASK